MGLTTPALALTPLQIAEKARDRDQENLSKYGATPCCLVEVKEELNEKGAVEEREEKTMQVAASFVPIPGGRETQRISPEMHAKTPKRTAPFSTTSISLTGNWKGRMNPRGSLAIDWLLLRRKGLRPWADGKR